MMFQDVVMAACQDIAQVIIIFCLLFASWSAWESFFLPTTLPPRKKLAADKLASEDERDSHTELETDVGSEKTSDSDDDDEDSMSVLLDPSENVDLKKALALLENYGVFAAPCGSWSSS